VERYSSKENGRYMRYTISIGKLVGQEVEQWCGLQEAGGLTLRNQEQGFDPPVPFVVVWGETVKCRPLPDWAFFAAFRSCRTLGFPPRSMA
jgi:hypothetical protein